MSLLLLFRVPAVPREVVLAPRIEDASLSTGVRENVQISARGGNEFNETRRNLAMSARPAQLSKARRTWH